MGVRWIIVDQLKTEYEGLFSFNEVYNMIDSWLFEKGFDRYERRNEEITTAEGKMMDIELRPWKKTTDYAKNILRIKIFGNRIKDVEVNKNGKNLKLNEGRIAIWIDAFIQSDYQNRWQKTMMLFFINVLFDTYIKKREFNMQKANLLADVNDLHSKIKGYFNSYRYTGEYKKQWGIH